MKIKKLLKSLMLKVDAIRIVTEKNIYDSHNSDDFFEPLELPEIYMNLKIKDFYIESYDLDNKRHFIVNIKV